MSDRKFGVERLHRVYEEGEGVWIEVGPDGDCGGYVEIRTEGKSAEYFGSLRLTLPPPMARLLGKALERCADELESAP